MISPKKECSLPGESGMGRSWILAGSCFMTLAVKTAP